MTFWSLTPALRAVLPQVVDKSAAARWRAGTGHSLRDIWSLRHGLVAPARPAGLLFRRYCDCTNSSIASLDVIFWPSNFGCASVDKSV